MSAAPDISNILNGDAGVAQDRRGITIQTLALSFAVGAILFVAQFTTFILIRKLHWSRRIYEPRSFLVPLKNRVDRPPVNPFKWIWRVFRTLEEPVVIQKAGLDAYFFLRYLSMCLKIFAPAAILAVPILVPLNSADGKGTRTINGVTYNVTGLDTLTWSNVSPLETDRYWAHLILAVMLIAWTCYMFYRELDNYIVKRQDYLASASHRLKASSSTVLITDIPSDRCTIEGLTAMYDDFPGGIRRIWLNRDYKELVAKVDQREKILELLESAETDLIRKAAKRCKKHPELKQKVSDQQAAQLPPAQSGNEHELGKLKTSQDMERRLLTPTSRPSYIDVNDTSSAACKSDLEHDLQSDALWTRYALPWHRSKMRIPKEKFGWAAKIPLLKLLFTRKVDTIYYCRRELVRLNKLIDADIAQSADFSQNGTAFIQFNSQKAAHLACQSIAHTRPRKMTQRTLEISPVDINWSNLGSSWLMRYLRFAAFIALFIVILLVLGLVSVFTGILSRVSSLTGSTAWLEWIHSVPNWLLSFIQGTLPPLIQVILLMGPLPIVLRAMTNKVKGDTTRSEAERALQLWYFILLVFELFIIPTISAGLTGVVKELLHFSVSVPQILATNLPNAVNYYYSFLVVQALSISASSMLQTVRLFNFYVLGSANSPSKVWEKLTFTHQTRIGSNIPWYSTFALIGLVYAIIAPLMLLFVLFTFGLFWLVIKNNLLFVVRTGLVDGGGLFFPNAINQLFTGVYFMEVCLIGLFFLVRDVHGDVACEAQGIIMAIVLVLTIGYQLWLSSHLGRLYVHAPVQLESDADSRGREHERAHLWQSELEAGADGLDREKIPTPRSVVTSPRTRGPDSAHSAPKESDESDSPDIQRVASPHSAMTNLTVQSQFERNVSIRSRHVKAQQHRDGQAAKHILARLHRPHDGNSKSAYTTEAMSFATPITPGTLQHSPTDPISRVIMEYNDELEDLTVEERDTLISVAFEHPVLQNSTNPPIVWIPTDELGVSADEIERSRCLSKHIQVDDKGAFFDRKFKVKVERSPPDMSEFALVMGEL